MLLSAPIQSRRPTRAFTGRTLGTRRLHRARGSDGQDHDRKAASGRGPQPARPGPAWRPATRPPVTRKPFGWQEESCSHGEFLRLDPKREASMRPPERHVFAVQAGEFGGWARPTRQAASSIVIRSGSRAPSDDRSFSSLSSRSRSRSARPTRAAIQMRNTTSVL